MSTFNSNNIGANSGLSGATIYSGSTDLKDLFLNKGEDQRHLIDNSSTALIKFGGLSINSATTLFNVGAVEAWFVNNTTDTLNPSRLFKSFTIQSGLTVTNLASQNVTYVAIDSGGTIQQSSSPFTETQKRTIIPLGVVVHSNRTNINAVNQGPVVGLSPFNQLSDFFGAVGYINISGNIYTANGANLNLNKSAGAMFKEGSNFINNVLDPHTIDLAAITGTTFRYRFQNSNESGDTTTVSADTYDNNGVATAVPSNRFTVQRICLFQSNLTRIQFGQQLYTSMAEAIAGIDNDPYVTETNISENGIVRALLVIRGGTTDLTDTTRVKIIAIGKFGSTVGIAGQSTTTLQGAYNNSTQPQITTDATLGSLVIKNGTGVSGATIVEFQNVSGTTNAFITGNGNFSGNSFTANTYVSRESGPATANSATTINLALFDRFSYTLSSNTTFTFSNTFSGKSYTIGVTQATNNSGLTATFTAGTTSIRWQNSVTPVMTPTSGKTDIFTFTHLDGSIFGSYIQNF